MKDPFVLSVPETTLSPIFFCTGIGSPVTIDSSTKEDPSIMRPSTGIFAPGFTMIRSSCLTSFIEISNSFPSLITIAVLACRFRSFSIASPVLIFDRASKYFPKAMKVMTTIVIS